LALSDSARRSVKVASSWRTTCSGARLGGDVFTQTIELFVQTSDLGLEVHRLAVRDPQLELRSSADRAGCRIETSGGMAQLRKGPETQNDDCVFFDEFRYRGLRRVKIGSHFPFGVEF
jgi:hypothetical protein